ncbi:hypothetical protein GGR54DRAFT_643143 [Hypoxylon sp. NC1633]|nr:hypothetical protein GGR54DRAFT_643143 [Hypoxylon sp. NC1633]
MASQTIPQSFKDREFFPSFRGCSWEDVQDTETNRKHWCLLGDIIQADTFIRPRIVARDNQGNQFVVAFYPDNPNDMPRLLKNFKVGNTIAIFYAVAHQFLDGTTGVRVEDSDKIIPLNLGDTMKMNQDVIDYTPAEGHPPKCHACDETKASLDICSRCTLFRYCDKDCQTKAWKEKGHQKFCKVLKDKNIKYMNFLNYGHYNGSVTFT